MLRDQVTDFVTSARGAGVDVTAHEHPDMVHNWMTLHAATPEAEKAFQEMGAFVSRLAGSPLGDRR
jgi:acetyl esterase/lipase